VRFHVGQVIDYGPKLVANPEHLERLKQGVDVWNAWRKLEPSVKPDLTGAPLNGGSFKKANLAGANLENASFTKTDLWGANLIGAELNRASFREANLYGARLIEAKCRAANFKGAILHGAKCQKAVLIGAILNKANLNRVDLEGAFLSGANLAKATFIEAKLCGADLTDADLSNSVCNNTDLSRATLNGCRIHGIAAWNVKLEGTKQKDLIITRTGEPEVTIDNIEVAQFVYLLLHNEKIRDAIDTIGRKGVLLLGRFTEGRIEVLNRLREELRKRGYLPIVFNFDKPETKDFTETVRLLAGLSKFVIADLSSPKSAPYELGAIVSQTMIPFQPIITAGETPFAMLRDLLTSYPDRVFQPIEYPSVERLVETMDAEIIGPAEARFDELVMRRAETLKVRRV
jgi:uncharacterized protein YjbI with pentapeptide repeats